jgi:hypothetical protein
MNVTCRKTARFHLTGYGVTRDLGVYGFVLQTIEARLYHARSSQQVVLFLQIQAVNCSCPMNANS